MKIIVGLGNPGTKYAATRHNVGFMVIDYLASGPGVGTFRSKFDAQVAEFTEGSESGLLVKPETFMNLSGESVRAIVDFYKLNITTDVLIICDDINLPLGQLRARAKGSDGGQKGLRSIQSHLGTNEYSRLRIGVDPPPEGMDAAEFVLARFKPGEKDRIEDAIREAAAGALIWWREGIEACMNEIN
jgi:PTH1 family peptidyl-tRNA hydrolase